MKSVYCAKYKEKHRLVNLKEDPPAMKAFISGLDRLTPLFYFKFFLLAN
jgi:hypothetical protein